MLSCWEAGQPTSALRAAGQHHRARTRDRQAWSARRPFPSRIFLSSLAVLGARESNSATRPVSGILSRWWWTGGWTGRLGREWWLVPDYTSGEWVPFSSSSSSSSSSSFSSSSYSSCHMPGIATETGCSPVLVLQRGVKLFLSDMTWCCGSAVKSAQYKHQGGLKPLNVGPNWGKCGPAKSRFVYSAIVFFYSIKDKHIGVKPDRKLVLL